MAKVSIIVPIYNGEKYIERSIKSLVNQTLSDIEIVTIDDHSTDKSYEKLHKLQERYPRKITILRNNQNKGAGYSRNRGLEVASGEYIGFLDCDDTVSPNMYKNLLNGAVENKADISRSRRKILFKNIDVSFLGRKDGLSSRKIIIPKKEIDILHKEYPCVTNKLFKRELLEGKRFPEHLKWEDYPYVLPIVYEANKLVNVSEATYYYHLNFNGTTVGDTKKLSPRLLDILEDNKLVKDSIPDYLEKEEVKAEIDFIHIQNILQRLRDILYSRIPLKEKKELISLFIKYMDDNYKDYKNKNIYKEYIDSRLLLSIRMKLINCLNDNSYRKDNPEGEIRKILAR